MYAFHYGFLKKWKIWKQWIKGNKGWIFMCTVKKQHLSIFQKFHFMRSCFVYKMFYCLADIFYSILQPVNYPKCQLNNIPIPHLNYLTYNIAYNYVFYRYFLYFSWVTRILTNFVGYIRSDFYYFNNNKYILLYQEHIKVRIK